MGIGGDTEGRKEEGEKGKGKKRRGREIKVKRRWRGEKSDM